MTLEISAVSTLTRLKIPYFSLGASCGFPSPADDFAESQLDLNEFLIHHPASTFFVRARGDSMIEAGIFDGDILIIDKSLTPPNNSIVLACIDGEFLVKRIVRKAAHIFLTSGNPDYPNTDVTNIENFSIEGLVIGVIRKYNF